MDNRKVMENYDPLEEIWNTREKVDSYFSSILFSHLTPILH